MLTQEKRPNDKSWLAVTWEDWIPSTDPITAVSFDTEEAGVTFESENFTGMLAFCFVVGGTAGAYFSVLHQITCTSGRVETVAIPYYVKDEAYTPVAP